MLLRHMFGIFGINRSIKTFTIHIKFMIVFKSRSIWSYIYSIYSYISCFKEPNIIKKKYDNSYWTQGKVLLCLNCGNVNNCVLNFKGKPTQVPQFLSIFRFSLVMLSNTWNNRCGRFTVEIKRLTSQLFYALRSHFA